MTQRMRWGAVGLGLLGALGVLAPLPPRVQELPEGSEAVGPVVVITIDGIINPVSQEYILHAIQEARRQGAQALLIRLDTPGGLLESTRVIVKELLTSEIPIVVYVAPSGSRAGSAGVFITLAAHVAAMAPGTNIGAAHPVSLGMGGEGMSEEMQKKVVNDAVAFIKTVAQERGRNQEWAELAVRESASITETEALAKKVIDLIAADLPELLMKLDGREVEVAGRKMRFQTQQAPVVEIQKTLRYRILDVISNPNVAFLLMLIGIYGLIFELSNPGAILPGVVGGIAIILALFAFQTLPVNYAGLLLILLSFILFIAEIKVPSYGLLTVGGVISFFLGALMLFDTPAPFLRLSWGVIVPAAIFTVLFFLFAVGMGLKAQRKRKTTGREGLVGEWGLAETVLDPRGKVFLLGEIWDAQAESRVEPGEEVEVVAVERLRLKVRKVSSR